MDARFHFISDYRVAGDPARVWDVLSDVEGWAGWWRGLESVDRTAGTSGAADVGDVYRQRVRTPLGYRLSYDLTITRVERMRSVDTSVSGDLVGRGRALVLASDGAVASIRFAWLVEVSKPWMRGLAPIARPAFTWAHRRLMAGFGRGFADAAGARLLATEHTALRPGDSGFWMPPEPPGR